MVFAFRLSKKGNFCLIVKIFLFLFLYHVLFFTTTPDAFAATSSAPKLSDEPFPIYPVIKPNVNFWIDIFTKYSKEQGIIHDIHNLNIIYDVIKLDPSQTRTASKNNKKKIKAVYKKYKTILLALSQKKTNLTKEEQKVAALFKPGTSSKTFKVAASNIRRQSGLKKQFREGLIRSGSVIKEFKRIFASHGLPADLTYLPCVESSFNFKAYSKFGAAGIWQFTRSTGKRYMIIGYVVDERRDPYISTDASARLLKKNYAELKNWPMAITAYNHGLAGMRRAKNAKGSYENIVRTYRSRSFKFASRNFYSEFLAARHIAKNPEPYFGKIKYNKPNTFKILKTKGYLSANQIASHLNISIKTLIDLNPSLRSPVINGQKYIPKNFSLRLPEHIDVVSLSKKMKSLYHSAQKPSQFHKVQKGDTTGSIARLHSVKLNDLILANALNRRATIYIGQNLRIPAKDEKIIIKQTLIAKAINPKKELQKKALSAEVQIEKPNKTLQSKADKTPESKPVAIEPPEKSMTVQAPKSIIEEPEINPFIVTVDLKILKTYIKKGNTVGLIKIEAEETLGHYSDWLKTTTQSIRSLNGFKYGDPISINQTIEIPIGKINAQQFEILRFEYHKEIEEDFFESFSVQGIETYIVKSGDNIWNVCANELELPIWLVKKYNPGINFKFLYPKQVIKYPIISSNEDSWLR